MSFAPEEGDQETVKPIEVGGAGRVANVQAVTIPKEGAAPLTAYKRSRLEMK